MSESTLIFTSATSSIHSMLSSYSSAYSNADSGDISDDWEIVEQEEARPAGGDFPSQSSKLDPGAFTSPVVSDYHPVVAYPLEATTEDEMLKGKLVEAMKTRMEGTTEEQALGDEDSVYEWAD